MRDLEDVMPRLSAQSLRANKPNIDGAAAMELTNWLERIQYACRCGRQGIYMDVLTVPPEIRDAVMAELRERGFQVSSVLEGDIRYNAAGGAFAVKFVYVDWRHEVLP